MRWSRPPSDGYAGASRPPPRVGEEWQVGYAFRFAPPPEVGEGPNAFCEAKGAAKNLYLLGKIDRSRLPNHTHFDLTWIGQLVFDLTGDVLAQRISVVIGDL